jgi:hypothetical protein
MGFFNAMAAAHRPQGASTTPLPDAPTLRTIPLPQIFSTKVTGEQHDYEEEVIN